MKSIKLAKSKYNKTRDPASKSSVTLMHRHVANNPVAIHPQLLEMIDPRDVALNDFKQQLSAYKPKQSVLEINIVKSQDRSRIE